MWIKAVAIGLATLFIVGVIYAGYRYHENLVNRIVAAEQKAATLESANKVQKDTIAQITQSYSDLIEELKRVQTNLDQVNKEYGENRRITEELRGRINNVERPDGTIDDERINALWSDLTRLLNEAGATGGSNSPSETPQGQNNPSR